MFAGLSKSWFLKISGAKLCLNFQYKKSTLKQNDTIRIKKVQFEPPCFQTAQHRAAEPDMSADWRHWSVRIIQRFNLSAGWLNPLLHELTKIGQLVKKNKTNRRDVSAATSLLEEFQESRIVCVRKMFHSTQIKVSSPGLSLQIFH